jgi:hypothetical protein
MQNEERQLAGYFNEESGIAVVECLLPAYYKRENILSVHIIEVPIHNILTFYYLFSIKTSGFGTIVFRLLPSFNDQVLNKPDPLDSLTWKWYQEPALIEVFTVLPKLNWGPFICDKIAQGIAAEMLSMDFTRKEETQKQWETVINNTVDHLTGLTHGGKEN